MQFIASGPNIPEELLQSHEDGQVVFFCGAGYHIQPICRVLVGLWIDYTSNWARFHLPLNSLR